MRRHLSTAILLALGLAGCAHSHSARIPRVPLYYVPSAAIVQKPGFETAAQPSQVLPASDGEVFFARGEKMVFGNTPIAEYSAYSIYTYDVQAIGNRRSGNGYRYRSLWQEGIAAPAQ